MTVTTSTPRDTRHDPILAAAFEAFTLYGYRRTPMEEIARRAGMSRPALYLRYAGKEEIFRALIDWYFAETEDRMRAALDGPGSPADRLEAAFATKGSPVAETLMTSPHGPEFLDVKSLHGAEAARDGAARLVRLLSDWLTREAAAGTVRLDAPADEVAATIFAALNGLMDNAPDYPGYCRMLRQLGRMVGQALTA